MMLTKQRIPNGTLAGLAILLVTMIVSCQHGTSVNAFSLVMMGARRGKGLQKTLKDDGSKPSKAAALNQGKGQEITGVTLPAPGNIKGWEFGNNMRMVSANVGGRLYALEGQCPRCAFDLWKGDMISDDPAFEDLPRIACPTCSTTYSLVNGKKGPALKRKGLQKFVGSLTTTATVDSAFKNAKAYIITRDDDGRVYCRER